MLKRVALSCFIVCLCPSAIAADGAPAGAVSVYNKKDYKTCAALLETYLRANPTNRVAYCYLANSYFALGRYDQAKKIAEYVITNFTMTPESSLCGELIARIPAQAPAPQRQNSNSNENRGLKRADNQKLASFNSGIFDIDSFIYTVRGNLDTGDVSAEFLQKVKAVVSSLPENILARLQHKGCRICVTPRMADKLPGFAHQKPRGWDEDRSGKHVDGLFNGEVIICENSISNSDDFQYVKNHRYAGVLRHELGHAVDWYFGRISKSEEFKHSYLLELARVDPDAKDREIAYYAQKSDAGQSECFAELFAASLGGGASKSDALLLAAFPNTTRVIKLKAELP